MRLHILLWAFNRSALNPIVYFALHRDLRVAGGRLFGGSQQFSWETVTDNTVTGKAVTDNTVTDNTMTNDTVHRQHSDRQHSERQHSDRQHSETTQ